jgi:hypothetical protein
MKRLGNKSLQPRVVVIHRTLLPTEFFPLTPLLRRCGYRVPIEILEREGYAWKTKVEKVKDVAEEAK